MPCDYSRYPQNWKEIVAAKKVRHNNKCELCYAPNGECITRADNKAEHPWRPAYTEAHVVRNGIDRIMPKTKIVLTVHHIDGNLENNHNSNLLLLCQKCHLRLDAGMKYSKKREAAK